MRLWMAGMLMGAMALPLAACGEREPAKKPELETPSRKAGLWRQTTSIEGVGGIPAVNICLDAATDKKLAWWAQQGLRGGCTKNDIKKNADGTWAFDSLCTSPEGVRTSTQGTASGDFQSSYQVKAKSTTEGAPTPEMNGEHDVTIDATWVSECPSNMRPGDLQLPDGTLVNLVDMTGG